MATKKKDDETIEQPNDLSGADAVQYAFGAATQLSPQELPYGLFAGWFDEYRKVLKEHNYHIRTLAKGEKVEGATVVIWRKQDVLYAALVDENGEQANGTPHHVPKGGIIQRIQISVIAQPVNTDDEGEDESGE